MNIDKINQETTHINLKIWRFLNKKNRYPLLDYYLVINANNETSFSDVAEIIIKKRYSFVILKANFYTRLVLLKKYLCNLLKKIINY